MNLLIKDRASGKTTGLFIQVKQLNILLLRLIEYRLTT